MGLDANFYIVEKKYKKYIEKDEWIEDFPNEEIGYFRKFYELDGVVCETSENLCDYTEFLIAKEQLETLEEEVFKKEPVSHFYYEKLERLKLTIKKMKETNFKTHFILYSKSQ